MSLAVLAKKPFVLPSSKTVVERLVDAIDDLMSKNHDTTGAAAAIAVLVGDVWGPEVWAKTAIGIGLPPPDEATKSLVVREFILRGMAQRAERAP